VGVGSWSGNFSSKTLNDGESKCISNCSQKFLKLTQRVGFRFAEYQAQKAQEAQQGAQP
jgi:import inner membrane translocase subunit TIM9